MDSNELVFVKLGGSLITDKRRQATPHIHVLDELAGELRAARESRPELRILLGHGSGSFGHWEASRYQTQKGVQSPVQWQGFAEVAAAAAQLNRIVVERFVKAGNPVLSLQPSASAVAEAGRIVSLDSANIQRALAHGLVPLIYGDVAFDRQQGGTILSTETLFFHLAQTLQPSRILLLGNAPGVLDNDGNVIERITPGTYAEAKVFLRGSGYTDVTGGMADKVEQMITLVQRLPTLKIQILTGQRRGNLLHSLLEDEYPACTSIEA